jgi:hypothetical protein
LPERAVLVAVFESRLNTGLWIKNHMNEAAHQANAQADTDNFVMQE